MQIVSGLVPVIAVNKTADVNEDIKIGMAEAIFALQIVADLRNRPPEMNSIGNKAIDESSELSFIIAAFDADSDTMTYSVSNLPDSAIFDPTTRIFSWTPTYSQSGTYNVTFTVTDSNGGSDSETVTITVNDKTPALSR